MKKVEIGNKKAFAPEKLSELSEWQLMLMSQAFCYGKKVMDAKVMMAYHILKPVWNINEARIKETTRTFSQASKEEREQLHERLESLRYNRMHMTDCFNWITEEQISDKWLIPTLTLRRWFFTKTFKGPTLRFGNITFWQWCQAEFNFFKFNKTGQRVFFNRFCACIFMPSYAGFASKFDDKLIAKNANWFNSLTPVQITAIKLNYVAIKAWLALNHPHVFKRSIGDDTPVETIDMAELLLRAAKSQNQDEVAIARKPLLVELKKLEIAAKDYAEAKQKSEDKE